MIEIVQDLKRLADNRMAFGALDVGDKAHAASVVLVGGVVESLRAGRGMGYVADIFGEQAARTARELQRVGDSGIPPDWNPGQALKPEQAEGLRKLLLALASDVRLATSSAPARFAPRHRTDWRWGNWRNVLDDLLVYRLGPSHFLLVVNIVFAFFDTFGIIDAATQGGPGQATTVLVYKVFQDGFKGLDLGQFHREWRQQ